MSAGVPVVCSDAGPLPEVAGAAARLVVAGDPDSLAAGLAEVLADETGRQARIETGRLHAAGYRWERCVAAMAALYQQILAVG